MAHLSIPASIPTKIFILALMAAACTPAWAKQEQVSGTASYRERIALPPDAVFEAVLEDVSRADAPAVEIGRTRIENPGAPPIPFSIGYDPAAIEARNTYAVRTAIRIGERLMFTSDTMMRVLTGGAPRDVAVMMRMVADRGHSAAGQAEGAASDTPTSRPLIGGMFVVLADSPRLTECRSDRTYPVAIEADYRSLESAYLEAREPPGQPLMATLAGRIEERPRTEGEGFEETVVVERFIAVWPGETCERNRADAALTNTYWRIVRLGDDDIAATDGRHEPHMLLRSEEPRFNATIGCNQLIGGYEARGETLRFGQLASTMMACPPPLDQLERRLVDALENTKTWHVAGQVLELRDGNGRPLALFQAVYLR